MHDLPLLILFLKAPRPGEVKTRLARAIGNEEACRVYRALAERQLAALPSEFPLRVDYSPPDAADEMRAWLGTGPRLHPQVEGDLGRRLERAAADALAEGYPGFLFIGADCPTLDAGILRQAESELVDGAPVVIGPALDGGYTVIGMRALHAGLFRGIDWGSGSVLEETLRKAESAGLGYSLLETMEDVDDPPSLERAITAGSFDYDLQRPLDLG